MLVVILLYDQLLFRPLVAWADRFRVEQDAGGARAALLGARRCCAARGCVGAVRDAFRALCAGHAAGAVPIGAGEARVAPSAPARAAIGSRSGAVADRRARRSGAVAHRRGADRGDVARRGARASVGLGAAHDGARVRADRAREPRSGCRSASGSACGRARRAIVQPIAQFLAAFPANLLFPVAVYGIVAWQLNPNVWLSPLMILGTQWYILFNVIAGASRDPERAARRRRRTCSVGGWLWWRQVALPGVFPYYVTGAITASGGSWNASDRRRGRELGRHEARGARPRRLHRRRDGRRRLPSHRARHRGDVRLRRRRSTACSGGRSTTTPSASSGSADGTTR